MARSLRGMGRWIEMDDRLYDYVVDHTTLPDPTLPALAERTSAEAGDFAGMQIGADEGAMLTALARMVQARFAVEVGTFTGYSSIAIARGLQPGGRLLCCDVSEEWTSIARDAWREAGVEDRIELRIAPAAETLADLDEDTVVDLAFIDADKPGYRTYYDEIVARLRPGGLVLLDNVLWSGEIVTPDEADENRTALRAINDHVAADDRVEAIMLPIADGLTIARKR